jgi:uncharacterized flavoprotein (TIGR03862 family)
MAAETAASAGRRVVVYERMPSFGRKFLMAGRGGLNLTHSEHIERFTGRYREAAENLRPALAALPPETVREWSAGLGQETFVGSSGRIFPKAMKASPLLRAWLQRLNGLGVEMRTRTRWLGWDEAGDLLFATTDGQERVRAAATVLALGGASWPRLGSAGDWVQPLSGRGIGMRELRAANCGFRIPWSEVFKERFEGQPLKRIGVSFAAETQRGEALITAGGIEGGAVYGVSALLRSAIEADGEAVLQLDLRPDQSADELAQRLAKPRGKQSFATFLRKAANLSAVEIGLLNEAAPQKPSTLTPQELATFLKRVPLRLTGTAPIETAISSAGGVKWDEVDGGLMLKRMPGVFVAGEMLDWEAPTGGYLLQACLATGALAGSAAAQWVTSTQAAKAE